MYVSGKYKVRGIRLVGGKVTRDLNCSTPDDERNATLLNFVNIYRHVPEDENPQTVALFRNFNC